MACEYCEKNNFLFYEKYRNTNNFQLSVQIVGNEMLVKAPLNENQKIIATDHQPIKFCPICGRKLGE